MNYVQLQNDVLERLNHDPTSANAPRPRIKRFLNEWYRRLLSTPGMSRVRSAATTITTAASTADYTLSVSAIREVYDATNQWRLDERTLGWLRERDPGSAASGTPIVYVVKARTATTITVTLWPTPTAIATINVDGESTATEMIADSDTPILPTDFHYLLVLGALHNEYLRMGDLDRSAMTSAELKAGQRDLRVFLYSAGQTRLVPGRAARVSRGRSRLGSFFPSDY